MKKHTPRAITLSQELAQLANEARAKPRTLSEAYDFAQRAKKLLGKPALTPLTHDKTAAKGVIAEGRRGEEEAKLPRIVITEAVESQLHEGICPETGQGIRRQPQAEGIVVAEGKAPQAKAGDSN